MLGYTHFAIAATTTGAAVLAGGGGPKSLSLAIRRRPGGSAARHRRARERGRQTLFWLEPHLQRPLRAPRSDAQRLWGAWFRRHHILRGPNVLGLQSHALLLCGSMGICKPYLPGRHLHQDGSPHFQEESHGRPSKEGGTPHQGRLASRANDISRGHCRRSPRVPCDLPW